MLQHFRFFEDACKRNTQENSGHNARTDPMSHCAQCTIRRVPHSRSNCFANVGASGTDYNTHTLLLYFLLGWGDDEDPPAAPIVSPATLIKRKRKQANNVIDMHGGAAGGARRRDLPPRSTGRANFPRTVVLAALVCKAWRCILLSDGDGGGFLRRYRWFHKTPPLLGYIHNVGFDVGPRYVPASGFSPPAPAPAMARSSSSAGPLTAAATGAC